MSLKKWGLINVYKNDRRLFVEYARKSYVRLLAFHKVKPLQSQVIPMLAEKLALDNDVGAAVGRSDPFMGPSTPGYMTLMLAFAEYIVLDCWNELP